MGSYKSKSPLVLLSLYRLNLITASEEHKEKEYSIIVGKQLVRSTGRIKAIYASFN